MQVRRREPRYTDGEVDAATATEEPPLPIDGRTQAALRSPSVRGELPLAALATVVRFDDDLSRCSTTADVIAAVIGPGLQAFRATAAILGLVDFRLRLNPVAGSAGVEELAARCARLGLDAPIPLTEAIRTGRPVELRPLSRTTGEDGPPPDLGAAGECAFPIFGARGIVGGLWLLFGPDEPASDPRLPSLLIGRLSAATDRARLLESEQRMRARAEWSATSLSRIQSLTSGLSAALGPVDVADVVMTHALAELGATGGTCYLLDDDGGLHPVRSVGDDRGARGAASIASSDPLGAIFRGSSVAVVPSGPDASTRNGGAGLRAIVPLAIRGEALGAIELKFPQEMDLDGDLRALLGVLGTQCAQAVERARLYAQRAREAHVLQASLMPPALPRIPWLDVAATYRPFGDGTEVGGDFYDLYSLEDGRYGIVVGDVSGKGIEAAAVTSLARHTTRAAALLGKSPAAVLQTLNRVMLAEPLDGRFCTIVHGIMGRSRGSVEVTLSLGGHPRPILMDRQSRTVRPVGAPGTAIGVLPDPDLLETHLTLHAGDALVLFTDGCVDFQAEGRKSSDERVLLSVLGRHIGADATELTERIEEEALNCGGTSADDATLVVVRAVDR